MKQYIFEATDDQDFGLTAQVAQANTERAAESPPRPALTNQDYFDLENTHFLDALATLHGEKKASVLVEARKEAPKEKIAEIDAVLAKADAEIKAILAAKSK